MVKFLAAIMAVAGLLPGIVLGDGASKDNIAVSHAWVREVVVPGMNGGAYFTLINNGDSEDRLVSVSTTLADTTELHETIEKDGMMHMQPLNKGIAIPAKTTVKLEPGGMHLMLLKVKRKIEPGERIPVSMTFQNAGRLDTYFAVQPLSGDSHSQH